MSARRSTILADEFAVGLSRPCDLGVVVMVAFVVYRLVDGSCPPAFLGLEDPIPVVRIGFKIYC